MANHRSLALLVVGMVAGTTVPAVVSVAVPQRHSAPSESQTYKAEPD
jgi:hypothetical protein